MTIGATLDNSGPSGADHAAHGDASHEGLHVQAVASHGPGNALAGTGYVAGIDLGGTKVLAAIFSPDGTIVSRAKVDTGRIGGIDVVERMAAAVGEAAKVAGLNLSQITAVGTGVPAPVNPVTGVVHMTPNIVGWEDMPLKEELGGRLGGISVAIDNDVRVAVIAEHGAGVGVGIRNMVGIWLGTGVGGGLILDGRIYTGTSSYAGEIGHITVRQRGALCGCGGRGHLEAYCSRTAMLRQLEKLIREGHETRLTRIVGRDLLRAKSSDLAEAAALGDSAVISVLDRTARYIAVGIATIANLLNPEMIVLGGGVIEALGDDFIANVAKRVRTEPFKATTGPLKIVASALGDDAGITGAAIIARQMQVGLHP
jgi:glucokinase